MVTKRKVKFEEVEMDMTPMIDVTFLLLIFFLCLEFKTLESKLSANLPKNVGIKANTAFPMTKLDIRIEQVAWGREDPDPSGRDRFDLVGHKVRWYVGPQPFREGESFYRLLQREARNHVYNELTSVRGPKPITIKTGPGVTYGDVTWVIDMARYAGFDNITIGGGGGARRPDFR